MAAWEGGGGEATTAVKKSLQYCSPLVVLSTTHIDTQVQVLQLTNCKTEANQKGKTRALNAGRRLAEGGVRFVNDGHIYAKTDNPEVGICRYKSVNSYTTSCK